MNILFITHYSSFYGANRSLLDLIVGLKKFDVRPFVIAPEEGEFTEILKGRGIEYDILPVPSWVTPNQTTLSRQLLLIKKLYNCCKLYRDKVKDWSIDIIHTNSSKTPIGRLVALVAGKPHIWHIREFLDLHYSYNFIFPKRLSLFFISTSTKVICISEVLKNHYFSTKKRNIQVIYDGVASEQKFDHLKQLRYDYHEDKVYKFALVGALSQKKGQHNAITALADIKERGYFVKLYIVGEGKDDYLNYCKALVDQLNVNQEVIFTGYMEDPYEIILKSDCLLVCSDFEAMGRVTIEAMSACLPVIGRGSGGTAEIIIHNETGFLYDRDEELINYMVTLIEDLALGKKLGSNGWESARKRFTIETCATTVYKLIQDI